VDRPHHPKPGDTLLRLARLAADAVWIAPGLTLHERCRQTLWCLALLTFPRGVVLWLVAHNGRVKSLVKPRVPSVPAGLLEAKGVASS
jgi:hypothetical protein